MYLPNKKRPWLPWLAGFLLIAFLVAFFHFLGGILTPFIVAAVLAYILNPLVSKLEAHGIKRARASMWVMLFALFLLTALLLVIVPMLVQQSQSIIQKLPQLADYLHHTALPWLNQKLGSNISLNSSTAAAWLRSNAQNIQAQIQQALPTLMERGTSLAMSLSNLILLPLLLYYFLLDWARWEAGVTELVPRRYLATYQRITGNMNTVLGEFLRGHGGGDFGVCAVFGRVYGAAAGNARRAAAIWLVERADFGVGGVCRGAAIGKFLDYAENRGRQNRLVAVLGDFFADGVWATAWLCGHAGGVAVGGGVPCAAARRQAGVCEQRVLSQAIGSLK